MAKFNKDTFLNEITGKVQAAIDKNLITKEDIQSKDIERLHGFIQYELLEYIEDRKFAIDVLKDFNYDEKLPWEKLQEQFGTFKSLMDIALVNLWKFLEAEKATSFDYYQHTDFSEDTPMLDMIHNIEDTGTPPYEEDTDETDYTNDRFADSPKRKIHVRSDNRDEN